jgi:hypothetical protein
MDSSGSAARRQVDQSFSVTTPRNATASRPSNLPTIRTTIVIPATLDQNLEVLRIKKGLTKNELIAMALSDFIRANNLVPDKTPSISVSYNG